MLSPSDLVRDLKITIIFCTRLPLTHAKPIEAADIARASWAMPLGGALVGLIGAAVYWLATAIGLPQWPAAALALAATMLATGCLHEDGLADTADGFGGGASRDDKLRIMHDPRHGSFAIIALLLSLGLRAAALATIGEPIQVGLALIAAHATSRSGLPCLMRGLGPARTDGLGATAGRPSLTVSLIALGIGGAIALGLLGPLRGAAALTAGALALAVAGIIAHRQIGGYTGDVLGACQQIGEIVMLLVAAAR